MKIYTGELDLEDLIRSIIILKNDIEIVLITNNTEIEEGNNILKIIYNKESYVKEIEEYLFPSSILKEEEEPYEVQKIVNQKQNDSQDRILVDNDNRIQIQKLRKKSDIFQNIQRNIKVFFSKFSKPKENPEVILILGKAGVR